MTELQMEQRGPHPGHRAGCTHGTGLMLAYMNQESLARTLESGETWFWSRSRGELWHKGATSGNTQRVVEVRYDCDADTLLVRVEPAGPACHTRPAELLLPALARRSEVEPSPPARGVLAHLEAVIQDRKANPRAGSYTSKLLDAGLPRMAQKVGEEAVETVVAAQSEGDERLVSELADLVYHALVLLAARDLSWADVEASLARRFA